ncbi:MAG: hypothetical protein ISR58_18365 [Anaerolineales bacterium]|nr:hypothetical protein [Chloroflexota bacterium]MBL6983144.1 hypothetical protein [Anaerolineales bacterium]
MSFTCPQCRSSNTLAIKNSIELPPDSRSDEIALQLVACSKGDCGFRGVAIYEESRRGALDSDHWDHTGYQVSNEDFETLKETLSQCPRATLPDCPCESHLELGAQSNSGRWQPPKGVDWGNAFQMVIE